MRRNIKSKYKYMLNYSIYKKKRFIVYVLDAKQKTKKNQGERENL